jgi:hypothetical protein
MLGLHNLPKHIKYKDTYKPFDYFWGLGVEHETYIQTSAFKTFKTFEGAMKPERYSVSYYKAYKEGSLKDSLQSVGPITIPILLNAYAMTNTDVFGEHETLFQRGSPPNPKYNGKPLFEWICEQSSWIEEEYNKSIVFDGDTIEFITQGFYRATVDKVIQELQSLETRFSLELSRLPRRGIIDNYGPLSLVRSNEPWATYTTNLSNISMFNNGTLHINVTLPTRLDWRCRPLWYTDFVEQHRKLARLIQWIEPIWVALYGSPDPFTGFTELQNSYAAGSQRLAVSRYIGLGTFDTTTMPTGKILQIPRTEIPWYDALHNKTEYEPLDVIGLDLNFNKHWAHGLEIRIFDQMPLTQLREVMDHLVGIMDLSLSMKSVEDPRISTVWQRLATEAMYRGSSMMVEPEMVNAVLRGLNSTCEVKSPLTPTETMNNIVEVLKVSRGFCWDHLVEGKRMPVCPEFLLCKK